MLKTKDNYHLFKKCLDEIDQSDLVNRLEEKEDEIINKGNEFQKNFEIMNCFRKQRR